MLLKILEKTIAFVLLLAVLAAIVFFLVYPNYSTIKIFLSSINPTNIARNTNLKLLTTVSKPKAAEPNATTDTNGLSLEQIKPEDLVKYQNGGNVLEQLEVLNTRIYIPSADINGPILDGEDANTLNRGFWHFPLSASPGKRGNAVVIGHRYDKLPPDTNTFFNLDKVQIGDKIFVQQTDNTYTYTVLETKVVEKNDRSILYQTSDYRITLVTCTPLWTDHQRLVIIAKLDKSYLNI